MRRGPAVAPSATWPPSTAITRPSSEASWSRRCSATTTAVPALASAARIETTERAPSSSSCESGSSRTSRRGRIARTPGERDALALAAGKAWRPPGREDVRCLSGPVPRRRAAPSFAGGMADVLEPERDVTLDGRIHGLQLGVLKHESDLGGEHPRGRGDDVVSQHLGPSADGAAMEMRHQPVEDAQERRLPRARPARRPA